MTTRTGRWVAATGVLVAALVALRLALAGGSAASARHAVTALLGVAALLALVAAAYRIRRDGRGVAPSWILLSASLAVLAAGHWLSFGTPARGAAPATVEDITSVVALVLFAAGLAKLPGAEEFSTGWRLALDAVVVACATMIVAVPHVFDDVHGAGAAMYVASGHLIAELMVITAALVALGRLRYPGGPTLASMTTLSVAGVVLVVVDAAEVLARRHAGAPSATVAGAVVVGVLLVPLAALTGPTVNHAAGSLLRERVAVLGMALPLGAVVVWGACAALAGGPVSIVSRTALVALGAALVARHSLARLDTLAVTRTLETKVAERTMALVTREQWFRSLVQNASDVVTVVDEHGVIKYVSPAVTRVFGHDAAVLPGTPLTYLMRPEDVHRLEQVVAEAVRTPRATYVVEFALWHRDGRWCETETAVTSLVDDQDIRGLVLNTRDVSERRRLEDALTHQAFHDTLTGLANRVLFADRVGVALAGANARTSVGVLFLDLDGFKGVNDTQGHAVGDQLLGLVAERLRHCIRPGDTVARLGGDEFAVLVHGDDGGRTAVWVAERIISALHQPFVLDGRDISVGVSIGIALNSAGSETADVLLRNADVAMYKAKARRSGGWVRFEPGMRDALLERVELENDLKLALGRGQLVVYYQPTVEIARGTIVGAEALLRWHHPQRGIIGPEEFIPLAEDTGVISAVGEFVLRETCRLGARWQVWAQHGQYFHVAVNISARQVEPSLVATVQQALADSGLPAGALVLEITESVLVERTDEVLALLHQLKRIGVRLAVDDFGTGYSSLSYLAKFPVDILKMDRSFIEAVGSGDSEQAELARTIVHLGRSLHLATVAEGIETHVQHAALRQMGCDYGQGYLFARPIPPSGLDELLSCRLHTPVPGLQPLPSGPPVLPSGLPSALPSGLPSAPPAPVHAVGSSAYAAGLSAPVLPLQATRPAPAVLADACSDGVVA